MGGKEGENAHGKCQRATLISVGAEGAVLGEAVVKVRRDQDQAWRFNGDGGGSGQDRTHEATHNANTIACSAGGGVGGGCGSTERGLSWECAVDSDGPTAASTTQMSRTD